MMADYDFIFRYGFTQSWTETASKIIGASDDLEYDDIEAHTDINSVYVAWAGDDGSGGDGTSDNPYRTLQHALANMTSDHTMITIMDSNYYYTGDAIDLYLDVDGIIIQGMEGQKPVLTLNTGIASQINMIRLQNEGKLINVELQIPTGYSEQVTGIDAREGTIQNVTIDGATKNGIQKTTSGEVTIENSDIGSSINDGENNGSGILFQEGTLNLDYSLIHSNDYAGIRVDGAGTKVLALDHSTVANNQYGIHEIDATNLSSTIIDSILYKNKIYDYYGSASTISYTCIGKINGSPTLSLGTNIIRINPLFVSNDDFRLRTKYNGFGDNILTSPCVGISSVADDMGCYQYTRSLSGQVYSQFSVPAPTTYIPGKKPVDGQVVIVRAIYPKLIYRGILNTLEIGWEGEDNVLTADEFAALQVMYDNDDPYIYLSIDNGSTYKKYLYDKTAEFRGSRGLVIEDNTLMKDFNMTLYEV